MTRPPKPDQRTVSETLFEVFCLDHGIPCERVDAGAQRTPDYRLDLGGSTVIAEIKQIDPNPEERKLLKQFRETGRADGRGTIGDRMRKVIGSGAAQLRLASKGRHPAILIVWNNVEVDGVQPLLDHTDPNQVKAAMYGFEQVYTVRDLDSQGIISSTPAGLGGGRKMTVTDNNSISGVGVLTKDLNQTVHLIIYHNVHADFSLPLFRSDRVHHFTLEDPVPGQYQGWKRL